MIHHQQRVKFDGQREWKTFNYRISLCGFRLYNYLLLNRVKTTVFLFVEFRLAESSCVPNGKSTRSYIPMGYYAYANV